MTAPPPSSLARAETANANTDPAVVEVVPRPGDIACPVIVCSPHSGRDYDLVDVPETCLTRDQLRRSEDAYVDALIEAAPEFGASRITAHFPRVFVDVNRGPWELDPEMFSDRLPDYVDTASRRAASGLGVIPRIGVEGRPLYRRRLRFAEASARLEQCYQPYHAALAARIEAVRRRFGLALVVDMHSMPSHSAQQADFVLGDRFGTSCAPVVSDRIEAGLAGAGRLVVRNRPYAGGYTTEHYGRPETGVHVVQIEINRGLYLDETRVHKASGWDTLHKEITAFIKYLTEVDWVRQLPR
ncbi:N-formylglutamate amidohydrolase [Maricaulis sp. CAU 1757]